MSTDWSPEMQKLFADARVAVRELRHALESHSIDWYSWADEAYDALVTSVASRQRQIAKEVTE